MNCIESEMQCIHQEKNLDHKASNACKELSSKHILFRAAHPLDFLAVLWDSMILLYKISYHMVDPLKFQNYKHQA